MGLGPTNASSDLVPSCSVDVVLTADFDLTTLFSAGYARELYVGTGGTVVCVMLDDAQTAHSYTNVSNGTFISGKFITVKSTANGTTASAIIARR